MIGSSLRIFLVDSVLGNKSGLPQFCGERPARFSVKAFFILNPDHLHRRRPSFDRDPLPSKKWLHSLSRTGLHCPLF